VIAVRVRKGDRRKVYDVRLRGPDGRVYTRTFETLREAKEFEASERADRARGRWVDPRRSGAPFSDAVASWMEANVHKRASSIERDRGIVVTHILPALGRRPLAAIAPAEIQRLVNTWNQHQAPSTVVREYAVLRAIFNHAVTTDLVVRGPCRGIRLPQAPPRESPLVTAADLENLARAMPGLEAMPYLGGVLGLRWAEVAALRVASFDFLRSTILIDRQWTRGKGGAMVSQEPKSRAGRRTLAVPDWLMAMVTDHLAGRGLTGADADEPVFVAPDGTQLHYSNWRQRVWLPATAQAGLNGLRFHDLRHTAGTALVSQGVDIKTAQVRLGHADPNITLRVYAQATQEADRAAAGRLGDLFRPGQSDPSDNSSNTIPRDQRAIDDQIDRPETPGTPSDQDFCGGARWNRTTDLSIISAAL
jgi:integrase